MQNLSACRISGSKLTPKVEHKVGAWPSRQVSSSSKPAQGSKPMYKVWCILIQGPPEHAFYTIQIYYNYTDHKVL